MNVKKIMSESEIRDKMLTLLNNQRSEKAGKLGGGNGEAFGIEY
jgi:hypothetical protein